MIGHSTYIARSKTMSACILVKNHSLVICVMKLSPHQLVFVSYLVILPNNVIATRFDCDFQLPHLTFS